MNSNKVTIALRLLPGVVLTSAAVFLLLPSTGLAAVTSLYDHFTALPSPVPAQTGNEEWTFHYGDQDAVLITPYPGNADYYGYNSSIAATFGGAAETGEGPNGTAGTNEAPGIFVHTANDRPMTAVYHFGTNESIQAIRVSHELVLNGNQGNGLEMTLRLIQGGLVSDVGTITITNLTNQQTDIPIPAGSQAFAPGDRLAAVFTARGSYLFDHGWVDIEAVPEPSTSVLFGIFGLGLAGCTRRRRAI